MYRLFIVITLCWLSCLTSKTLGQTDDWPMRLHDNERSGRSSQALQLPLQLQWGHQVSHPPQPAWPPPAKQDFWHNKTKLEARVTFDRAFHLAATSDKVYFGSSADDQLRCLEATTGKLLWSFFAEGPIRLAPSLANGRVFFGSDDGYAYALNAESGRLVWKTKPNQIPSRRLPGNGRMISLCPVRSSILVEGDTAFYAAGLFPEQGAFHVALEAATGNVLDQASLEVSPQGYLEQRKGKLFLPTGRHPAGKLLSNIRLRISAAVDQGKSTATKDYLIAIQAGNQRIAGGSGRVDMFLDRSTEPVWSCEVDGDVHDLAVAGGRLLVSTDRGMIYAFGSGSALARQWTPEAPIVYPFRDESIDQFATKAVRLSGNRQGYALVLNAGTGPMVEALARNSQFRVVGIESDSEKVEEARRHLDAAGIYGTHVAIHHSDDASVLRYTDKCFNLIVDGDPGRGGFDDVEIRRLLVPGNGVAFMNGESDRGIQAEPMSGAGEWTHMYASPANTACSEDRMTSGELQLQWFGAPGPRDMVDRHHRTMPSLFKSGRLFIPGDNRIYGVDAYNGTVLWEKETPNFRRIAVLRDCGSMVATDEQLLYVAKAHCHALNVQTGEEVRRIAVPNLSEDISYDWGYIAAQDDWLVGSAVKPGASRNGHSKEAIQGAYWDNRPPVCSDALFCLDQTNGNLRWAYQPDSSAGVILNPSITIAGGHVFFVQSNNPESKNVSSGRVNLDEAVGAHGATLVCLGLDDGNVRWQQTRNFPQDTQHIYGLYGGERYLTICSHNEKTVRFQLEAYDRTNGKRLWTGALDSGRPIGGEHGEQDRHPLIVGDKVVVEPAVFSLKTGERLAEFEVTRKGGGCGSMSASADSLFFRASNPSQWQLTTGQLTKVTTVTRPGCWINMIPAGGLLLVPEGSAGCTCNYAVQTSMAFLPK